MAAHLTDPASKTNQLVMSMLCKTANPQQTHCNKCASKAAVNPLLPLESTRSPNLREINSLLCSQDCA